MVLPTAAAARNSKGGRTMSGRKLTVMALTIIALTAAPLAAQEERRENARADHMSFFLSKLNLSDQQRQEVQKIRADFEKREEPIEQQLWMTCQQERTAMQKVLNDEQRKKVPTALRAIWEKEANRIGAELGLNDNQLKRCAQIRQEYFPKFHAIMERNDDNGFKQASELKREAIKEVMGILNEEQRAKLPGVLRAEFHRMHDKAARQEQVNAFAEQLGLGNEQREQVKKLCDEYNQKLEKPITQFKQLHREATTAVERILTPEQRERLQTLEKNRKD